ncbi:hypothetical protein CFC21_024537 [Triticum aestivum]|uniref:GRAM domain-containing protein n=2 Tax=Triticum aestivum TaxID=4565 RepID=A0A3B6C9S7_WHEAT|nr:GEM-like protein 4 [Triticum dicoccoides]XP_044320182.1 GEM-like protein 4 [Triticum aestivum]KAF7010070.1 hypothetical protein CFC21_024537 [Triticum aestivum]
MKSSSGGHVVGVPVTSKAYGIEEKAPSARDGQSFRKADGDHLAVSLTNPSPYTSFGYKHSSKGQVVHWVSKLSRRAQGFREHVTLGPKISETVKGKLSLGAKILQAGGIERVFRKAFTAEKGERLVKALQCYLYTTGGPIAGMLFVSTKRIAFRSDRPVTVTSPRGDVARVSYKVVVPLKRIDKVRPSENVDRPEEKYIHVATVDGFEFWFMGFVSYQRSCKYMQQVIGGAELQ